MKRRNLSRRCTSRRRRRGVRRRSMFVNETFVTNVPKSAISTVPVSIMTNVPKFSIWRPRTVRIQATAGDGTDTYPAIQIIMYNSGGEKVSSSQVRLLNVVRTNIYCHYPRTAEWFSPIQDDSKSTIFDIRVLCTGTKVTGKIGLIINMSVEVKNEIPAVTCPTELNSRPFDDFTVVDLNINSPSG